jgi:hypothetical protein
MIACVSGDDCAAGVVGERCDHIPRPLRPRHPRGCGPERPRRAMIALLHPARSLPAPRGGSERVGGDRGRGSRASARQATRGPLRSLHRRGSGAPFPRRAARAGARRRRPHRRQGPSTRPMPAGRDDAGCALHGGLALSAIVAGRSASVGRARHVGRDGAHPARRRPRLGGVSLRDSGRTAGRHRGGHRCLAIRPRGDPPSAPPARPARDPYSPAVRGHLTERVTCRVAQPAATARSNPRDPRPPDQPTDRSARSAQRR